MRRDGGSSPAGERRRRPVTRRRCGARRLGRRGVGACGRLGVMEIRGLLSGLGRILRPDTYRPTYPIFAKIIIIIRILGGYVFMAYRICIRIRYVSDTRYATKMRIRATEVSHVKQ